MVYSTVYSDTDQRKHQSSASLAFVRGIHREPVYSLHKWPVTRKVFPFDDVIMNGREMWQVDSVPMIIKTNTERNLRTHEIGLVTLSLSWCTSNTTRSTLSAILSYPGQTCSIHFPYRHAMMYCLSDPGVLKRLKRPDNDRSVYHKDIAMAATVYFHCKDGCH